MKHDPEQLQRATEAERLLKAADAIRERGWQNSFGVNQRICILQALTVADGREARSFDTGQPPAALVRLARARVAASIVATRMLAAYEVSDGEIVFIYNDNVCDSQDSAISLLEEAARAV